MPSASNIDIEEQINKLKDIKDKKSKGIDYRSEDISVTRRDRKGRTSGSSSAISRDDFQTNPNVRRISLTELINISREMKGEKVAAFEKKTPFISREKEIKAPEMNKKGM